MGAKNAWTSQVDWHTGRWQARGPAPSPRPWQPPLRRGVLPKRPLTFFEVLDSGFRLLRFVPGPAIGAPLIVFTLWTLLLTAALTAATIAFLPFLDDLGGNDDALTGFSTLAQAGSFILSLLSLGLAHLLSGIVAVAAQASFGARRTNLRECWTQLRGRRWRLVLASALVTAVDLVLLVLFALPSILLALVDSPVVAVILALGALGLWICATVWLNLRLAFLGAAIAIEGLGMRAGLRRTWTLTARGFWRTFGQLGLGYLLSNQLVQLIISPLLLILSVLAFVVISTNGSDVVVLGTVGIVAGGVVLALTTVSQAVLFGYFSCLVSVCYFDSRMRAEGFDLELIRREEASAA